MVFLNDMLEKPELMYDHVRRYTASVIGAILYGHRASTFESPFGRVRILNLIVWFAYLRLGRHCMILWIW